MRTVFVAGGAGGMGSEVARQLAAVGHRVVVADIDLAAARAVAAEVDGLAVPLDVTDGQSVTDSVAAAAAAYGPVEICVNVVGWERKMPLSEMDEAHISRLIDVNLTGAIRLTSAVAPAMVERGWGRIIYVTADAAAGVATYSVYGAAKAGVNSLTRSMAAELGPAGITVNALSPGAINTELFVSSQGADYDKTVAMINQVVPLRRVGEPSEAAAVIRFLASEDASYVSAQIISANGGRR